VRLRTGIRALVVDTDERVALVRFDFPARTVCWRGRPRSTLLRGACRRCFRELLRDGPPVEPIDVGV